jgi:hypothetical protein
MLTGGDSTRVILMVVSNHIGSLATLGETLRFIHSNSSTLQKSLPTARLPCRDISVVLTHLIKLSLSCNDSPPDEL